MSSVTMPYGKYRGKTLESIPDDYLLYVYEKHNPYGTLKTYIEDNLDEIKKNAEKLRAEFQAAKDAKA
jgi:uncharacterized protein (DUF3820 family)